jgi:sporulation protein YlmC with PRC-barrel domain
MAIASTVGESAVTHILIPSDRVEGTAVRRSDGTKIGTIQRLMIDKASGRVAYAVLKFGGILGLGQKHYPIPWSMLKYSTALEAYEASLTEEDLNCAPSLGVGEEFDWGDRTREAALHDYYRARPYWGL